METMPAFTPELLQATVEEAHAAGGHLTVHLALIPGLTRNELEALAMGLAARREVEGVLISATGSRRESVAERNGQDVQPAPTPDHH